MLSFNTTKGKNGENKRRRRRRDGNELKWRENYSDDDLSKNVVDNVNRMRMMKIDWRSSWFWKSRHEDENWLFSNGFLISAHFRQRTDFVKDRKMTDQYWRLFFFLFYCFSVELIFFKRHKLIEFVTPFVWSISFEKNIELTLSTDLYKHTRIEKQNEKEKKRSGEILLSSIL